MDESQLVSLHNYSCATLLGLGRNSSFIDSSSFRWSTEFDGLENILGRLPVFQLLQCRSVCKAWNKLICSQNFKIIWSKMNALDDSWVVLVKDVKCTGYLLVLVFYNVRTKEWRLKELNLRTLLAMEPQLYSPRHWYISLSTAKGLILLRTKYNNPDDPEFMVVNPFDNSVRHFSDPLKALNSRIDSNDAVDILGYGPHQQATEGYPDYGILVGGFQRFIVSANESCTVIPFPSFIELFEKFFAENAPLVVRLCDSNTLLQVNTPGWVGIKFNFMAMIACSSDQNDSIFEGCISLSNYDLNDKKISNLLIPYSWNLGCGHWIRNWSKSRMFMIQRENLLVVPFLEIDDAGTSLSMKLISLDIRLKTSSSHSSFQNWQIKATMPNEMFEAIHERDKGSQHLGCFRQLIVVTDDNTDQLIFMSNASCRMVSYRFPSCLHGEQWTIMSYPMEDMISRPKLNEVLTSPNMAALMCNFQFRPDIVP